MVRANPKILLAAVSLASVGTIFYVHQNKENDRARMKKGVVADIQRKERKRRELQERARKEQQQQQEQQQQ